MQLRYNREQLLQIRKQLADSKSILPKEITIKLQQYVLNTENGTKKTHRGCRAGRSIKEGKPPRNMKLSKNKKSNSRINQTSICSSVSIDGKTRPIVHNTHEWFTP